MIGEKVIENSFSKSIKLVIKEDVVTKIDKYGTETTTTYSNGTTNTGRSFTTNIYYGKDYYIKVYGDIPIKEGWTIKTLYLELDGNQYLLCYKIIESNYYKQEIENVSNFIATQYRLTSDSKITAIVCIILLLVSAILALCFVKIKIFLILLGVLILTFIIISNLTFGCPSSYDDIISYINKAVLQFKEKGKQLAKK